MNSRQRRGHCRTRKNDYKLVSQNEILAAFRAPNIDATTAVDIDDESGPSGSPIPQLDLAEDQALIDAFVHSDELCDPAPEAARFL